jgi:hypothetical protein
VMDFQVVDRCELYSAIGKGNVKKLRRRCLIR